MRAAGCLPLAAALLAGALEAQTATPGRAAVAAQPAGALAAGAAIDLGGMKESEIRKFLQGKPDGTLVRAGGKTMTVGDLKKALLVTPSRGKAADVASVNSAQKTKVNQTLQAGNQKVLAHVSQLATDPNAQKQAKLRDEAYDLTEKLKTASPTEKTQIQQRLQQIGSEMKLVPAVAR